LGKIASYGQAQNTALNLDSIVQSDTAIKRQALPSEWNASVIEYGSIRSNSSNRSKRFERPKRLKRFEPGPLVGSPLDQRTVDRIFNRGLNGSIAGKCVSFAPLHVRIGLL
jgi:hypothetical protein